MNAVLRVRRAVDWFAIRGYQHHGIGYCQALQADGRDCGEPAWTEITTPDGDEIAVCAAHEAAA